MSEPVSPLLSNTDKAIWHGYVQFYEAHLPAQLDSLIVEFGVLHGQSIRWLSDRYPHARIVGVDILEPQSGWPVGERITYRTVDQGREDQVAAFFAEIEPPALIIEDGSHLPAHQSRCLRQGVSRLRAGGTYVLEDIHTSHPSHAYFRKEFGWSIRRAITRQPAPQTSLTVLLALEHARRQGEARLSQAAVDRLAGGHLSSEQIRQLDEAVDAVSIYRRATLPSKCYRCGRSDFDYNAYRCACGTHLFDEADSMSAVIRKRA